jgi:ligand-binding SRPBCC domain-containing protein
MKINLSTTVEQDYLSVKEGFNESLFKKLSPPFPPVKLIRFDGSSKGDLVSLELNFIFFKQKWISEITDDHTNESEFYFVDEGIKLPFFLGKWKHKHRIVKSNEGAEIKDEIEYEGPNALMTALLYPALYLQFLYRKPIYKKIFNIK